jgi:hypothetical protein
LDFRFQEQGKETAAAAESAASRRFLLQSIRPGVMQFERLAEAEGEAGGQTQGCLLQVSAEQSYFQL